MLLGAVKMLMEMGEKLDVLWENIIFLNGMMAVGFDVFRLEGGGEVIVKVIKYVIECFIEISKIFEKIAVL